MVVSEQCVLRRCPAGTQPALGIIELLLDESQALAMAHWYIVTLCLLTWKPLALQAYAAAYFEVLAGVT
jgi:hypothetical protein